MSSVNPSDGATSPSANTFVFDTGRLKKDEYIVRNQEVNPDCVFFSN